MRFHTVVKLGPNREITPAGFTLFKNVSIARTGEMIYGPNETEVEPGPDGLAHITRTPEEVFRAETLASFNGAPFVIDHPQADVGPDNWQELSNGFFVDIRRGAGDQKDEMVGDLLVTTAYGVAAIDSGEGQVSAGYDADYVETGPGRGEQRNIIGNHVALVEQGRCGPRCAINSDRTFDEERTCICLKVPCTCRTKSDDEEPDLTATEKFKRASDRRWGIKTATIDRSLTGTARFKAASDRKHGRDREPDLKNLTPTQRFIAGSKARWARK